MSDDNTQVSSPESTDVSSPISPSAMQHGRAVPPFVRWLVFLCVVAFCAVILTSQPAPYSTILFVVLVAAALFIASIMNRLRSVPLRDLPSEILAQAKNTLPGLSPGETTLEDISTGAQTSHRSLFFAAEIIVVVVAALLATTQFANLDDTKKLPGYEGEWLTSSAHFAAQSLRDYGYIPLWQPWLESGEPLIDGPFSFVLNPISTGPSLALGAVNGIKISVVLTAVLAGVGGWMLGYVFGFGSLGRVLLGLLMVGKGNMHAMLGAGYFQLGASQAYFPWIIAGTVAILRKKHARWPVALTAITFMLLFLAGNIWYTLPMLLSMVAITVAYSVRCDGRWIDWVGLRRLVFTGVLTLGLCAITLLPLWVNRDYIGGHPKEIDAGTVSSHARVVEQFFNGSINLYNRQDAPGPQQFYYSFVIPVWFVLLLVALFPLTWSFRYRLMPRLWFSGLALAVFFTVWGTGGHPWMIWLYRHIPLLDEWRFVGRALAVASFWIAVLVALLVDRLWVIITSAERITALPESRRRLGHGVQYALAAGLVILSLIAARQVIAQWRIFAGPSSIYTPANAQVTDACIQLIRQENPDKELAMYRHGYDDIFTFIENKVRIYDIEADYFPRTLKSTLGDLDFTTMLPEYGMGWNDVQREWLDINGYELIEPERKLLSENDAQCHSLYRKADAFSYAFSVSVWHLPTTSYKFDPESTTPVSRYERLPDTITLWVQDPPGSVVVAIQERAYPGWRVEVDGKRAELESFGGLVAVLLAPDQRPLSEPHEIRFLYRPWLLYRGAAITLSTIGLCIMYMLRVDRYLGRFVSRRFTHRQ
ncbi:MAG: hypothetical protein JW966_10025 [Anaerolineae bacterium]|nr:hypothetical protein [Anaerolineae bacterium]